MSHYTEDDFESISDIRHLVMAAASVARLDEALSRTERSDSVYLAGAMRSEAISIAALEGSLVRMEAISRLLGDRQVTNLDRSVRLAADIHDALERVNTWGSEPPSSQEIRHLFDLSDASSGRRLKQDLVWVLEEDCLWLYNELLAFMEKPNPWDAIENIRSMWTSGRFLGTAKRMALLISGWMIGHGLGCSSPVIGLGAVMIRDTDAFRQASQDRISWLAVIGHALDTIGREGLQRLVDGNASRISMLALCPPEKSSSSIARTIDFMMKTPVFRKPALEKALGLTPRGAQVVLDKLEEADVVEVDGSDRKRTYVCRRAM